MAPFGARFRYEGRNKFSECGAKLKNRAIIKWLLKVFQLLLIQFQLARMETNDFASVRESMLESN